MIADDLLDRSLTAGEYVLGLLPDDARLEFVRHAATDPAVRAELRWWEAQLAPLGLAVVPVAPRPVVWTNVLHALGDRTAATARRVRFWRTWAAIATAASVVLALGLWQLARRDPPLPVAAPALVAVLKIPGEEHQWTVSLTPALGRLAVRASGRVPSRLDGRAAELWWIAPGTGDGKPASLGVIPARGEHHAPLPPGLVPAAGGTLAVSLEPPGGSPSGQPTGPVVIAVPALATG